MKDHKMKNEQIWEDDSPDPRVKEQTKGIVTPRHKLRFAGVIMICAAVVFLLAAAAEIFYPSRREAVEQVWKFSSLAVTNLITLIVGFYFGERSK